MILVWMRSNLMWAPSKSSLCLKLSIVFISLSSSVHKNKPVLFLLVCTEFPLGTSKNVWISDTDTTCCLTVKDCLLTKESSKCLVDCADVKYAVYFKREPKCWNCGVTKIKRLCLFMYCFVIFGVALCICWNTWIRVVQTSVNLHNKNIK